MSSRSMNVEGKRTSLGELALLFLRLGATSFGGPAAHTAMMEDEVVRRRGWLTRERFLDMVGATNLIPGPNSTELAIHIGALRGGPPGLIVAGVCFILPAVAIVTGLAWAYVEFGTVPQAAGLLAGVQPVVIAIVLQAVWRLGRTAVKTRALAALGAAATLAVLAGVHELVVLFGAGALWVVGGRIARRPQFFDAIAVGQVTPGPVFTTATFVGYVVGGAGGSALATVGIFLPAFVFVALSAPLLPRLRASIDAAAFLDAVNVASLALMTVVTWRLGVHALHSVPNAALGVGAFGLLRLGVSSAWLVVLGALVGLLLGV